MQVSCLFVFVYFYFVYKRITVVEYDDDDDNDDDSEHQARTIKILQSLCISVHKIVETYRNQHAPNVLKKGKRVRCANGSTDQSRLWM
jgi:hypothetical protein